MLDINGERVIIFVDVRKEMVYHLFWIGVWMIEQPRLVGGEVCAVQTFATKCNWLGRRSRDVVSGMDDHAVDLAF